MKMKTIVVAVVTAGLLVSAYVAYDMYHIVKSNGGSSPVAAWFTARRQRGAMDRELAKILHDADKK